MRILVVDDNKEGRYLLETMLKGNGFEVVTTTNGAEALEKLRTEGLDMIIADILMPVMDGFRLCREYKEDEKLKDIPFVFYTATYTDAKDEELALKVGADKFIRKPAEPEEFIKIIQGVIRDAEEGRVGQQKPVVEEEKEVFKLYSERLVNKLEKKMLDLEDEITRRRKIEEQLRSSLADRETLLKELHHRVKNNMQVISSLLNLQSKYVKDEQMSTIFVESQNRIRLIALLHEKLYESKDLARIHFGEYIRSLVAYLFSIYRVNRDVVKVEINTEDIFLDIATAIPCALIINELVSNSLKHAFPDNREGEIHVDFYYRKDNEFILVVSDNGIGFPELDFRDTKTMGFQLVTTLVDQLQGTIELDRNGETTFRIIFKKPE